MRENKEESEGIVEKGRVAGEERRGALDVASPEAEAVKRRGVLVTPQQSSGGALKTRAKSLFERRIHGNASTVCHL